MINYCAMSIDYKSWYENARIELQKVQEQKSTLHRAILDCDTQIAALVQTMNAIAPLIGAETLKPPGEEAGMTDCIRAILTEAGAPLTASEIRGRLEAQGFDMKSYSNPLANIHTILRRLTDSKAVETTHEVNAPAAGKRFAIAVGKDFEIEKVWGKSFQIGKFKTFAGKGKLKRRSRVD